MRIRVNGVDVSSDYAPEELDGITLQFAAWQGEQGSGSIPVPDPTGTREYYSGQPVIIDDGGSTVVFDGFIASQERERGQSARGPRRLDTLSVYDTNALLYGFRAENWVRPEETDVARVLAFRAAFVPSVSVTNVPNTHTVTLPAKTYNTDDLTSELLQDINARLDKTLFVVARDLHYHRPLDCTAAPFTISDTATPSSTVWPPYSPRRSKDPSDLRTNVLVKNKKRQTATASDAVAIARHDAAGVKHEATIEVPDATQAELQSIANRFREEAKAERLTYACRIGPFTTAQVAQLKAGQMITVTSQLMGLTASSQRISRISLSYERTGLGDRWWADLELDRPVRIPRAQGGGLASYTESPLPSNSVVSGHIVDGAIVEEKMGDLAVSLRVLMDGAVTGTKIADDSISSPKIQANAIQALHILAGSVGAEQIAALGIVAGNIAAGAIESDKIAANAVTAGKLAVGGIPGGGGNAVANGSFEDRGADGLPESWTRDYEKTGTAVLWTSSTAAKASGARSLAATTATTEGSSAASRSIPVNPGDVWYIGASRQASTATADGFYLRVLFGNADGFLRTEATSAVDIVVDDPFTTSWTRAQGHVTVPAGATWMRIAVYCWLPSANTTARFDEVTAYRHSAGVKNTTGEVLIDSNGVTVNNAAIVVRNGNNVVIIDGSSEIFLIAVSATMVLPANPGNGDVFKIATHSTGLNYDPASLWFTYFEGWAYHMTRIAHNRYGNITRYFGGMAAVTNGNQTKVRGIKGTTLAGGLQGVTYRYYVLAKKGF